jgi:hypothetical protein
MSLPGTHRFRDMEASVYCTSIGTTPVACYLRAPNRGTVLMVSAVTQGAITTADCTVAFALNGTANTAGNITIPYLTAAAGQVVSSAPTANIYVSENDYITLTPSGASGSAITCMFIIKFRDTQ